MIKVGQVSLVGAGPGDWRLLTLGAKEVLENAEVVIYDRLASDQIMKYAAMGAEKIYVGKASNQHTLQQEEINELIVQKAKEGKRVVRLKGGDPFVFGRGGEEAIACLEAGVSFEIIPGVTSAIGAPAYAGIPVTHRQVAASFTVITGHEDPTKEESSHRWEHLAHGADTLIFLMGVENLPNIQKKLLAAGKDPTTPVAFVRWGTRPNQETWITTLEKALSVRDEEGIKASAILIIGPVVNLRNQLTWFDRKPLFGKTVLVTRAREQASKLSRLLEDAGAFVIETPLIHLEAPDSWDGADHGIAELENYEWVIFTSSNGVDHFMGRLFEKAKDVRSFKNSKIAVVGTSTGKALENYGLRADLVAKEFRAEGLLKSLEGQIQSGQKVLIVRPEEARNVLPDGLAAQGVEVTLAPVYRTIAVQENQEEVQRLAKEGKIDWITLGSASTVKNLLDVLGESHKEFLDTVQIAAIGPLTAEEAEKNGMKVTFSSQVHTISAMVEGMIEVEEKMKNA